ncbi:2Fe-2S iron-sulfur cluster-binding protein [Streptomyces sp. NPDC050997]|uniref:2Fe-2S iron-sulfur cluster-binding protein n=1 Tax=Streptomyces sp. NPDC050997 TaxID=3155519 RepID=UPI00341CC86A
MTDDQHEEGTPRSAGRWDPLPQGDYDDGATAFVKLPEGGIEALLASADSPLAAPGHGYVPPQITVNPATTAGTDPAAAGTWAMPPAPVENAQWPDPNAVPHTTGDDRFTYNPGSTGQWNFEETGAAEAARAAAAQGHDVTGQWSIPVADGDLPDESGEFTTSALVEQWGGTPPATLPGGASAPWATEPAGQPWGQPPGTSDQPTDQDHGHGHGTGHEAGQPTGYGQPTGPAPDRPVGSEYAHGRPSGPGTGSAYDPSAGVGHGHDQPTDVWSGLDRSGTFGGAREQYETHGGVPSVPRAREPHPHEHHAPEHHTPEQHQPEHLAPQARAADAYAPEAPEAFHAQERPAPEDYASEDYASEDYAPVEPRPTGHEPPRSLDPEPPPARTSEHPQPFPPERQHGEASTEEPAETAVASAQRAHGPGEAIEAEERAQRAVAAAERAADAAAEASASAPGAATDAEPGPEPAAGPADEDPAADPEADEGAPAHPGEEHPLASYVLRVNGAERPVTDAWIGESLLYVLRERLGLAGAKDGCSQGECGACNIQVDGRLVASCLVPGVTAAGSEVRTVEGLAVDGQPSDVQRALAKCGAVQCGFCVPGMAMTVHDLLEGNPAPTEMETRQALCGNLCRCSGYRGVVDAVQEVVAERESHSEADAETDADEARIPHQAGPGAGGVHRSAFEPADHDQAYGQGQDGGQA